MTVFYRIFTLLIAGLLLWTPSAYAQDPENLVKVRILAEKTAINPGDEIWIGVEQNIAEGWHTYWSNPGDSGTQTRLSWSAPEGFEFGEIQWPVPKKLPYGDLMNYGYENSVTLLQRVSVPEAVPEGPITLSVDFDTLVCKEECIPESGTYEIILNSGEPDEDNTQLYIMSALASVPQPYEGAAMFKDETADDGTENVTVNIAVDPAILNNISTSAPVEFFPQDWGIVENAAPQAVSYMNGQFVITQARGERDIAEIASDGLKGVLKYTDARGRGRGLEFTAIELPDVTDVPAPDEAADLSEQEAPATQTAAEPASFSKLAYIVALALLGGLTLNLMPCVFPVLSMKALSLVKSADKERGHVRLSGIAYTLGVVLSFLLVAGALIALQAAGAKIGWGFHLQNPFIVGGLVYILMAVGLNLSGVFEFSNRFGNIGQSLTQGQGVSASFFTGVLATIVATPCTAPFMAPAIGFALTQSAVVALMVFAALGFGLALPYLLLCFVPATQKIMPKPGPWMDSFKAFLAFPVYASAAWLMWVFAKQSDDFSLLVLAMGFVGLVFVMWLLRRQTQGIIAAFLKYSLIILTLLGLAFGVRSLNAEVPPMTPKSAAIKAEKTTELRALTFSNQMLQNALASKDPVFVEMTAAWCITCKVNHKTSINIEKTRRIISDRNVQYIVGDWTNQDSVITQYLESFERNGVPIYVYYPAPDENGERAEPELLPQILTPGIVAKYLDQ